MTYKDFSTNQVKQYKYFEEMAEHLNGTLCREKINGMHSYEVRCPVCGRRKSRMYASKRGDTYMFGCPRYGCMTSTGWGCNLHQLITERGPEDLQDRWNKARATDHTIKNRRPRGPSLSPTEPVKGLTDDIGRLRVKGLL